MNDKMRNFLLLLPFMILAGCSAVKPGETGIFPTQIARAKYLEAYDNAFRKLYNTPYTEEDVVTTFGTAHVILCGPAKGAPLVLLHGTDASSSMWYPNIKAFSQKYRVYAIDFPLEAGKSVPNSKDLTNHQVASFYNQVFGHYHLDDINLVGASRGGWIAMFLALKPNNKVKKLALISPAQTFEGVDKKGKALSALALKMFPNHRRLDTFFKNFSEFPDQIKAEYKEQFYLANVYGHSKPGLMKMVRFNEAELKSLNIPVLVLVGDHDIINTEATLIKAKALLPRSTTAMIKDAGHFLSVDQADTINKKVLDFLEQK